MKLYQKQTINEIRDRFGFSFSKSLGQNFLTDKNIIDGIIEAAEIGPGDMVIEIGPGIGVLTREAAMRAKLVNAIEIDRSLIPVLGYTLQDFDNVRVLNADILKTDLNELIKDSGISGKVKILGNLPYYITTPIIMKILEDRVRADSIIVMMQKEVADRLKAPPGKKECGAISLMVQYFAEVEEVLKVPRTVFVPSPKVDSSVLRLKLREQRAVEVKSEKLMFDLIKASFGQRRKTLSNSLLTTGLDKKAIVDALEKAGIDPMRRGETLNLEEFAVLSDVIYDKTGN